MPRIGARPTACQACRARRKACDGRRPGCTQCERRHVICPGYSKELDVVLVQPGKHDDATSEISSSDSNLVILQSNLSQRALVPLPNSSAKRKPLNEIDANPQILPAAYLAKTYQTQALGLYLDTYLPRSRGQGGTIFSETVAWLPDAIQMSATDPLLHDALLALSLSHLGDGQLRKEERGRLIYGNAVKALSARIRSQEGALSDSTLAAILAMGWYEGQAATVKGAHGWLSHVKGANALVQVRGKQNFSTPFGEKLFLTSQLTTLIAQIGRRKAFPISSTWPKKEANSYLRLFRIMKLLPAILEHSDFTREITRDTPEEERTQRISMLAYLCEDFRSRMSTWYDHLVQYEAITTGKPYWPIPSTIYASLPKDSPARVLPDCYDFTNLDVAQQLVLYWTGSSLVNMQIIQTDRWFQGLGFPVTGIYPPDMSFQLVGMSIGQMVRQLVQSMEYFVHPDRGKTAQDFLGLPLNLVFGYFSRVPGPEVFYLKVIVQRLTARDLGLGPLVEGMAKYGGGKEGLEMLWNS